MTTLLGSESENSPNNTTLYETLHLLFHQEFVSEIGSDNRRFFSHP